MLTVDILNESVGVFRIGQQFPLPKGVKDKENREIVEGDGFYIDPYHKDVVIGLRVSRGADGLYCRVVYASVDDTAGAFLYGKPMGAIGLGQVLEKLKEVGVYESSNEDSVLILSSAVRLGVFGDRIDKVSMGGDPDMVKRTWNQVIDPKQINALLRSASVERDDSDSQ